jgi:hypothetical protein
MQIFIKVKPWDKQIGEERFLELESIWNSDNLVKLSYMGQEVVVVGSELIDSIKRVINRPFGCTD